MIPMALVGNKEVSVFQSKLALVMSAIISHFSGNLLLIVQLTLAENRRSKPTSNASAKMAFEVFFC
jgi:hypothetical protein